MGESARKSGNTLLCFALLCFCTHEQHCTHQMLRSMRRLCTESLHCTHQMKPQKTKMLLRSQAVQHWHDRRWHAVAWLMGQAVQHWHCFRRIRTTQMSAWRPRCRRLSSQLDSTRRLRRIHLGRVGVCPSWNLPQGPSLKRSSRPKSGRPARWRH